MYHSFNQLRLFILTKFKEMNFFIRRFWRISLMATVFCLLQSGAIHASDDSYQCIDANLDKEQLALMLECGTAPVITCPSIYYDCPGGQLDPIYTGYATAIAGDADCPAPVVTYTDEVVVNTACHYEVHRTWTAEYPGNSNPWLFADCTQILYLFDTSSPLIKNCPSDITIPMNGDCVGIATWNEPVYTDNCGVSAVSSDYVSGTAFPEGVTTVTYTVSDNCGNTNTCSFDVTVNGACCLEAPTVSCPADITICPGGAISYHPSVTGFATVTTAPGCPTNPILTWSDDIQSIASCPNGKIITRTWTAMDPVDPSKFTTCIQMISMIDTEQPTTISCPTSMTIHTEDPNGAVATWNDPVFEDNCGISGVNPSHLSGSLFPEGCTTVAISAFDNCGNFVNCSFEVCIVVDKCEVAPIIICPPNRTLCPGGGPEAYHPDRIGYATATAGGAFCDAPIVTWEDLIINSPVCPNGMQVKRTWTASDPENSALKNSCLQIIDIEDISLPIVDICGSDITLQASDSNGAIVTYVEPSFSDNCGIANVSSSSNNGDLFPIGITEVTYTASNNCGNTVSCSFNVVVSPPECMTAPIILCPADITTCVDADTHPNALGFATATASGTNCDAPIISWSDYIQPTAKCAGALVITRTWTAEDPNNSSLSTSCEQLITTQDHVNPILTNCPTNISVIAQNFGCEAIVNWTAPTATDNCDLASVVSTHAPGDTFSAGNTTVTYTATDACGNASTCSFTVIVTCANIPCSVAPIINCPADYSACPGASIAPNVTGYATATAGLTACDDPIVSFTDAVVNSGPCQDAKTIHRTWTATDPYDATVSTSCVQVLTLNDTTPPVVTNCPADISLLGDINCQAVATWVAPVSSDNCGAPTVSTTHPSGSTFNCGTTTVTYTFTDACGNSTSCSFNVTVTSVSFGCAVDPVINCPADYYGCVGTSSHPSTTGFGSSTPGLGSCDMPITTYADAVISSGPCAGAQVIHRTWTATDPNDATVSSSCVQVIALHDDLAPIVNSCPSNILLTGDSNCQAVATWNEPIVTDNCGIESISSTHSSGSVFGNGTTTVTYTITDNCGHVSTCSFTVTVTCAATCEAPIISCPGFFSACPGTSTDPATTGYPTVSPGSADCGTPILTYADQIQSTGPCAGATYIFRIWTATDPDNAMNFSQCVQAINLEDNAAPALSSGPSDIVLNGDANCQAVATWSAPVYTDNCGIATINSNLASGSTFGSGTTTVSYTVTDYCGNASNYNFNVTVNCTIADCLAAPILNCPADWNSCPGSASHPSTTGFASATPGSADCDTPIVTYSDQVVSTGPCNGATLIYRTWTATDPSNNTNKTSCVQTISLADTTAPTVVSCPDNIAVLAGASCSAPVTWVEPIATDNCGIASISSNYASGSEFATGTSTVVYTITDNCGNVTNCSFNVTISCSNQGCSLPPVINCPADYSACVGSGINPSTTGYATATAGLASCDAPVVTFFDTVISTGPCAGAQVISRKWIATDPNNSSVFTSCTQTISVGDSQAPTFVYCPEDMTIDGGPWCDGIATWSAVTATDNCSLPTITSTHTSGELLDEGVTTVTYTATDDCGNTAQCSFNITVECNNVCDQAPMINCPANVSLCPGSSYTPSQTGYATATSGPNCGTPTITYNDIIASNGTCGDKVIHRVWTATEPLALNLSSSCTQIITLADNFAPGIWDCPADLTVAAGQPAYWIEPIADDNCSLSSFVSTHASGTVFSAGTTTVSYTATDVCGNISTCAFNVTTTGPAGNLTCPNDIVKSCGANGGAYVNWTPPTFSGTCNSGCSSGNYIPGFIYMGSFGGSQYYCSINPATWPQAEAASIANGGHLASINNAEENAFLANVLINQTAWIGFNDKDNEGIFTWSNGDPVTYTNWFTAQPNDYNYNQDYVGLMPDGFWNDEYNYSSLEYIMEISCDPVTQTGGKAPGSFFEVGTHTISYAVDAACGGATCSFTVTVEPSLTLECPNDIVISAADGESGAHVNWTTPTANSCCTNCTGGGYIPGFLYMGSYNGHYYYCSLDPATWTNANASSQSYGGYLASINSAGENNFLANILTIQSAWIGLNDISNPGTFTWSNGDPLSYSNWYPQQPNNYDGNQNYVEMLSSGLWNDQYNDSVLEYIMEIPGCVNVTQTGGPNSGSYFAAGSTTTINYQASDECGNIEYCSFNVIVNGTECNSGGYNSDPVYIAGVGFGDLNNTSGNDGGYQDYTNQCANIEAGGFYPISLTPGFGGYSQKCYWKVWIDFNLDGDYTDDGEYIAYGVGTGNISGTISIPWNIWNGQATMRVVCKSGGYPTSPCEQFSIGETEDYCINILGGALKPDQVVENRSQGNNNAISLQEVDVEYQVNVYPNPAVDYINIEHSAIDKVDKIEIYNATGKVVRAGIGAEEHRIDLDGFENGMYILSTRYIDGNVSTTRFIVQQR